MDQTKIEEERIARDKQDRARKMLHEIEFANELTKTLKNEKRMKEKEEDDAILMHVQQK